MSVKSVHHASGSGSAAYIEELEMNHVPQKTDDSQSVYAINEPSRNLPQTSVKLSQTKSQRRWTHVQFASCCFALFLAGWNDGTTGPLLPRIQEDYHVNFAVVSLIFVFACLGSIFGAALNFVVTDRLGFGKAMVLGSLFQVVAFALLAAGGSVPFPVFVLGFTINNVGGSLQDAQANGYVAGLRNNAATKMGMMHAAYGAGAFCSPLVATQFAQEERWSFHYLVSLGIALLNTVILVAVFRFKSQDGAPLSPPIPFLIPTSCWLAVKTECFAQIGQPPQEQGTSTHSKIRQVLSLKAVHLLACFIFAYVGVEVTIGGWIVTFIIDVRGGGASSGYISAGFFGGLMVGRVALLWVNKKVGERRVLFIYAILAIGLEVVIWLVPSLIGDAVAVSIVGMLLGPIYPIVMNESSRILPRWLLTGSIGWIAGFGQAGSALFPFITGALASKVGIKSLQPL
ncbi:hypothetical protein HWV62_23506 [Athelia sp. TMB]|nr:hypothetical protein HWV62_23506 [Athelia sp. TMB]